MLLQYLWDWGVLGAVLVLAFLIAAIILAVAGNRSSFVIFFAILISGIIEPTLNLTLKSFAFFAILAFFKHSSTKTAHAFTKNANI
jgi:hypothetical protein